MIPGEWYIDDQIHYAIQEYTGAGHRHIAMISVGFGVSDAEARRHATEIVTAHNERLKNDNRTIEA